MKKSIPILTLLFASYFSYSQCNNTSVQVSASDTSYVQLYHPGFFLIPSGFSNVCEWEITTFSGELIYQETTSGTAFEQGSILFDHEIPISDSMKVHLVITNTVEGILCTIDDTLFWEEIEVLPGSVIGNWAILNNNGGVEDQISSTGEANIESSKIVLYPNPGNDYFYVANIQAVHSVILLDVNGRKVTTYKQLQNEQKIELPKLSSGLYYFQFYDQRHSLLSVIRFFKI